MEKASPDLEEQLRILQERYETSTASAAKFQIKRALLSEVKSNHNPPAQVKIVMDMLMIIFREKTDWAAAKSFMQTNF